MNPPGHIAKLMLFRAPALEGIATVPVPKGGGLIVPGFVSLASSPVTLRESAAFTGGLPAYAVPEKHTRAKIARRFSARKFMGCKDRGIGGRRKHKNVDCNRMSPSVQSARNFVFCPEAQGKSKNADRSDEFL